MKFVSVDGTMKRVAHTSGVIEMIGKDPVDLPVYEPADGDKPEKGYKGLKECAMLAGCVPFNGKSTALAGKDLSKEAAALADERALFEKEKAEYFASMKPVAKAVEPAVEAAAPVVEAAKTATGKTASKAAVILE